MTTITRCDLCGAEHRLGDGEGLAGWASVTVMSPKLGPGRRGPSEHLDLCPSCATDLRVWIGERMAKL